MKRIIIGADVVPEGMSGRDPIPHFISGEMNNLVEQGILDLFKNADFRVVNLEVPLTDKEDKLQKSGPNLIWPMRRFPRNRCARIWQICSRN